MSRYDVENAIHRLTQLGVDVSSLRQDYYKIPLENIDDNVVQNEEYEDEISPADTIELGSENEQIIEG
jgi:hypothetical protein